jgi:hypothetical protein
LDPELDKLPVVTIKGGQASANVEQPWVKSFRDESSQLETVFIIDTTGKITGLTEGQQGFLLTKTQLVMRNPQNPFLQPLDLAGVDDTVIDAALIRSWIPTVLGATFGIAFVFLILWYAAAKLVQALLIAVVGLIVNSTRRRQLRFGAIYGISIYALTPAILLDVLRSCAGVEIPWFWFFYMALAGAFAGIAVKKLPDLPPGEVAAPPGAPPPGQ